MNQQRQQLTRRYRKVSWGRLYWKRNNPNSRQFDSDDVCIVRNGVVSTHYKSLEALIKEIEYAEGEKKMSKVQDLKAPVTVYEQPTRIKLSPAQRKLLKRFAEGWTAWHYADVVGGEWNFNGHLEKIRKSTANSLADHGFIAPVQPDELCSDYTITDLGRSALNGVQAPDVMDVAAAVETFEMPVAQYLEQDTLDKRASEAVQHEADTFAGIERGDLVHIETSNANMPFVGRVVKLVYGGWVVAQQSGNIRYKATIDRVRVLRKALTSAEAEASA